ncbi:MAG: VCBS repeat-containing protein, partial [Planctomycetales bacterium]|nr:VCBS repeat-containing protein [Planctomycetales bacterium]
DFDGDGDVDLLVAAGSVLLLENDGGGVFTLRPLSGAISGVQGVGAGDIDGDGDLDLLATGTSFSYVVAFINDGAQNFVMERLAVNATEGRDILASDVNGDGKVDVVAHYGRSGAVSELAWLDYRPDGQSTVHVIGSASTANVPQVRVGDLDGDGDVDLVTQERGVWFANDGTGNFTQREPLDALGGVALADLDGDGSLDYINTRVAWGNNDGAAGFAMQRLLLRSARTATPVDIDQDGDLDLLTTEDYLGAFLWENVASADYGDAPANYATENESLGAFHPATGPLLGTLRDVETDGTPDAQAAADLGDDGVSFAPLRVGQLAATAEVVVSNAPAGARLDAWIDFNGDGAWSSPDEQIAASALVAEGANTIAFDVPAAARSGLTFARFRISTVGGLAAILGAADGEVEDYAVEIQPSKATEGRFASPQPLAVEARGAGRIEPVDLDQDGDLDFLFASSGGGRVEWYERSSDGTYAVHTIDTTAFGVAHAVAADFDRDGDLDVAAVVGWIDHVRYYRNDGLQGFELALVPSYYVSDFPRDVLWSDFDTDGDVDLLFAEDNNVRAISFRGDALSTATYLDNQSDPAYAAQLGAGDVDGDGLVDVVAYWPAEQQLRLHRTAASATETSVLFAPGDVRDFQLIDFDADSDLDVLLVTSTGVAWWEQSADGSWGQHVVAAAGVASAVDAADLDGDGDFDVLVANSDSGVAAVYFQQDDGSYVKQAVDAAALSDIVAADVDGDGDLDLDPSRHGPARLLSRGRGSGRTTDLAGSAPAGAAHASG